MQKHNIYIKQFEKCIYIFFKCEELFRSNSRIFHRRLNKKKTLITDIRNRAKNREILGKHIGKNSLNHKKKATGLQERLNKSRILKKPGELLSKKATTSLKKTCNWKCLGFDRLLKFFSEALYKNKYGVQEQPHIRLKVGY